MGNQYIEESKDGSQTMADPKGVSKNKRKNKQRKKKVKKTQSEEENEMLQELINEQTPQPQIIKERST